MSARIANRLTGALALALGLATGALAQSPPITEVEGGLAVDLAGHHMVLPQPFWTVPSSEPVAQAQTLYNQISPGVDSLLLIPVDETVVTWTQILGVLAVHRPGYRAATHLVSILDPMREACLDGQLLISTFPEAVPPEEASTVLILCGRYRLNADVPKSCAGGIIAATVLQSTEGAAKIYHEWCTGSFDIATEATWPVAPDVLSRDAAILLASAKFVPIDAPAAASEAPPAPEAAAVPDATAD